MTSLHSKVKGQRKLLKRVGPGLYIDDFFEGYDGSVGDEQRALFTPPLSFRRSKSEVFRLSETQRSHRRRLELTPEGAADGAGVGVGGTGGGGSASSSNAGGGGGGGASSSSNSGDAESAGVDGIPGILFLKDQPEEEEEVVRKSAKDNLPFLAETVRMPLLKLQENAAEAAIKAAVPAAAKLEVAAHAAVGAHKAKKSKTGKKQIKKAEKNVHKKAHKKAQKKAAKDAKVLADGTIVLADGTRLPRL